MSIILDVAISACSILLLLVLLSRARLVSGKTIGETIRMSSAAKAARERETAIAAEYAKNNPPNVAFLTKDVLVFGHVPGATDDGTFQGRSYYLIDKPRSLFIHSSRDYGYSAKIVWKYNLRKMKLGFKVEPLFDADDRRHFYYPADDTLGGVEGTFKSLAFTWIAPGDLDWRDRSLKKTKGPVRYHERFTEDHVWAVAKQHPIDVISVKYEDHRPKPQSPKPSSPDLAIVIGETIPPEPEPVPDDLPGDHPLPIPEASQPFPIPYSARDKAVYVLGMQGMGKSTLLRQMIQHDISLGRGVGVIDPHGDLAEAILRAVPSDRVKHAIYFDPVRSPIGIDFFRHKGELERDVLADDLVALFHRLAPGEGQRMSAVLKNAFILLVRTPGATLLDLYRLLAETEWRTAIASQYADDELRQFWLQDYPNYPHPATEQPLISRLQKFRSNAALRRLAGTISNFDFHEVIRRRQILICNLSAAYLRGETKEIIGSLLVMQIHLAALRQAELPPGQRTPFYLYVDEFQNFGASSFNEVITGARKFALCLTLANQKLADLDEATRNAVLGANYRIYFRPQDDDAKRLGSTVGRYDASDLLNLDEFECIARPGKPSDTRKVRISIPPTPAADNSQSILERTQAIFPSRKPKVRADHADRVDSEPQPSGPPE